MQEIDLRGIIPAIVTPMTNAGELDLPALRRYVQWLAEQGPVALAVNVDTGEGPHLTADEKRQTLETVAEAVAGKCKVVGGVAGPSTAQGIANARAAQIAGCGCIVDLPDLSLFGPAAKPRSPLSISCCDR